MRRNLPSAPPEGGEKCRVCVKTVRVFTQLNLTFHTKTPAATTPGSVGRTVETLESHCVEKLQRLKTFLLFFLSAFMEHFLVKVYEYLNTPLDFSSFSLF